MAKSLSVYKRNEPAANRQRVILPNKLPDYSMLSEEQFDAEMEKGIADTENGRTVPSKQVKKIMQRKYR